MRGGRACGDGCGRRGRCSPCTVATIATTVWQRGADHTLDQVSHEVSAASLLLECVAGRPTRSTAASSPASHADSLSIFS